MCHLQRTHFSTLKGTINVYLLNLKHKKMWQTKCDQKVYFYYVLLCLNCTLKCAKEFVLCKNSTKCALCPSFCIQLYVHLWESTGMHSCQFPLFQLCTQKCFRKLFARPGPLLKILNYVKNTRDTTHIDIFHWFVISLTARCALNESPHHFQITLPNKNTKQCLTSSRPCSFLQTTRLRGKKRTYLKDTDVMTIIRIESSILPSETWTVVCDMFAFLIY